MVGAVALALAGCSSAGKDGGGESGDASGTMKMWTHNAGNEAELAVVKHIIDDWNESHDIKVQEEAFPQASYNDAIVAAASSGDLPCILDLDEAARLDGASWWTIYSRLVISLSKPTIATVAIITMLPAWNSYLWPLMVIQSEKMRPASVGMQYFFQLKPVWGEIMAYGVLITLPVLILFFIFQKQFVTSLAGSGLKD